MKSTPTSILTGLAADVAEPYLILDMEFAAFHVRLTNLPFDVSVGGNTYVSDGGLTKFSPPQLTNVADKETYRIELVDFNNEFKSYFDNSAIGTDVTVRLGITGNYTDLDTVYKGRIDATQITMSPSDGTKDAIIECSSPFGALDRTNERLSDDQTQKGINATDTCFENIYKNIESIQVRWGKKP